jgi:hypothetical protein
MSLIAGVEQSGYSSLTQSTDPFLQAFIHTYYGWARIRLLGAPQPSTQGIVSLFTDPTGQLTSQDYTKVGAAIDFVFGPQIPIKPATFKYGGLKFITGLGFTTPLPSNTVTLTYKAPPAGSQECLTLVDRFSVKNGYSPGLTPAPAGSAGCLANGVTDVAFSNQDRSSFLLKYGAGVRFAGLCRDKACDTPGFGNYDLVIGQDAAITRGILRHFVLKLDGEYPLPYSGNYLYLFGSAAIRFERNKDQTPLILQTETSTVTIPSTTVVVLPLQQPDRDFYRLGVGLNISQIFTKINQTK